MKIFYHSATRGAARCRHTVSLKTEAGSFDSVDSSQGPGCPEHYGVDFEAQCELAGLSVCSLTEDP